MHEHLDAAKVANCFANYAPIAPWLWRLEVTNALLVKERRKLLTSDTISEHLRRVDAFPVELISPEATLGAAKLADFARPYQLTAYDATYLDLAIRRNLPLCTLDSNLRIAAARAGVVVLP
jgi:predicted nucleic acid-binding protein